MAPVTKRPGPQGLVQQALACKNAREVTTKPLYHLGKASLGSGDSFKILQETIDYLDCRGKAGMPFTGNEKEFLVNLYESLGWGGVALGTFEAAKLARHYVHGGGGSLRLDPAVYQTSVIVQDGAVAMKAYIREQHALKKSIQSLNSADPRFLRSKHAHALQKPFRDQYTQGVILPDGALQAEQNNRRLHYSDNRFHLGALTHQARQGFVTRWSVNSLYDFEPYPSQYYTVIPVPNAGMLKLPDGLSNYMEKLGIAKRFWYMAEWSEPWR
jgi:hypothetical protein